MRRRLADRRKVRQGGKIESAKDIRKKSAPYLSELEDAIPVEFVEARSLTRQMATDAVEVLIARRNQHLHNQERLAHGAKRYRGASEGSLEAQARDSLQDGVKRSRRELVATVKKLENLLCFLDGEAEVKIREPDDTGAGEEAIVKLLRDYCEENKIALSEPLPDDPARLAAAREVEELAGNVKRALNGAVRTSGSAAPAVEPDRRQQQAAVRAKTTS